MEFELDIPTAFSFITHDHISFPLRFQILISNVFLQKKNVYDRDTVFKNLFSSLLDVPSINLIK